MSRFTDSIVAVTLLAAVLGCFGVAPSVPAGQRRLAHEFATAGSGTRADPWVGWGPAIESGTEVHFVTGFFEADGSAAIVLPSDVALSGADRAIVQWPVARTSTASIFDIPPGTENIVIRGLRFEAGVSVPRGGLSAGGGGAFITLGAFGRAEPVRNILIHDNHFGVMRYGSCCSGLDVHVRSATEDLVIRDNRIDAAPTNVLFARSHATVPPRYKRIVFSNNRVEFTQTHASFGFVFSLGLDNAAVFGSFEDLTIRDNTFRGTNTVLSVSLPGAGLNISYNDVRSDNLDGFLQSSTPSGGTIDGFVVSANSCFADDPADDAFKVATPSCQLSLSGGRNGTIVGNSLRGGAQASVLGLNHSEHVLVALNTVDKARHAARSLDWCFTLVNSSYVTAHRNECIDVGDSAFYVAGDARSTHHLTFEGNELLTTGGSAVAGRFFDFTGTSDSVVIVRNKVLGRDLVEAFVGGSPTRLFQSGNVESAGDAGARNGAQRADEASSDGLVRQSESPAGN